MQDLARTGLPHLSFLTSKTHIEGIDFSIFPDRFNARYWLWGIFSYTSKSIRPCFYSSYESIHT